MLWNILIGVLLAATPVKPGKPNAKGSDAANDLAKAKALKDTLGLDPAVPPQDQPRAPSEPASESTPSKGVRLAVYDLQLEGVDKQVGSVVTDSLLAEVRKLERISAIGMAEINDMLTHELKKDMLGCSDVSCMAELAGALGVDNLLTGRLARVGDNHVIVVRRIDQQQSNVIGTADRRLKAESGQEFLLSVGGVVADLFPEFPLREGKLRGVAREVALRLDPPPLPTWSTYAVAGGAGVAAVIGAASQWLLHQDAAAFDTEAQRGLNGVADGAALARLQASSHRHETWRNVSFVTAGTFALSAAIMAFFTDWHGYGTASRPAASQ